jgi:hypothetical protein
MLEIRIKIAFTVIHDSGATISWAYMQALYIDYLFYFGCYQLSWVDAYVSGGGRARGSKLTFLEKANSAASPPSLEAFGF